MAHHIVLLGDSILDNGAYTEGEPDVREHLSSMLPPPWKATLCAVDGSTTKDLPAQLSNIPSDASHLVISIGGNDALQSYAVLKGPSGSTMDVLILFSKVADRFEARYRAAIEKVLALGLPTVVCTIYNGNLEPADAPPARVALMAFNDTILRVAFEHRLPVIDLRPICCEPADYANHIEPSSRGGRKIAQAITVAVGVPNQGSGESRVFGD